MTKFSEKTRRREGAASPPLPFLTLSLGSLIHESKERLMMMMMMMMMMIGEGMATVGGKLK